MSDVNLSISQEVVRPIIEAKIHTAIASALADQIPLMDRIVNRVLMAKVDTEGKESCYARNDLTFVQWLCSEGIRKAAKDATIEAVEKMKPQLQALIVKELEKRKGEIAGELVKFFVDEGSRDYRIQTAVTITKK